MTCPQADFALPCEYGSRIVRLEAVSALGEPDRLRAGPPPVFAGVGIDGHFDELGSRR